ncbi:MAG: winged helix-turn-helix transcriptional regulator [Spirochaetales bacterium]|nr:winged helix-turn-helix transcriptional regulator [Spirochaetales bacterium]
MCEKNRFLVDSFKALGDETRFSILCILIQHNICAKSIACRLKLSESAVSQHLKILRECGLISGEKRGYWVHYKVNVPEINRIINGLNSLVQK